MSISSSLDDILGRPEHQLLPGNKWGGGELTLCALDHA